MTAATAYRGTRTTGPSPRQRNFMLSLAAEREAPQLGATAAERRAEIARRFDGMTWQLTRSTIDWLLRQPRANDAQPSNRVPVVGPGIYQMDEAIYAVKRTQDKQRLYAKRLVPSADRLTEADTVVRFDYEYAPGVVGQLRPEHRMAAVTVEEMSIRYERCLYCGRHLEAADSVKRGIGPVCRKTVGDLETAAA